MHQMSRIDWSSFPLCALGYGFLYAWGYVLWETPVLSTRAVGVAGFDLSWLVSAVTVPIALVAIVLWARISGRELDVARGWPLAASALGAAGTLLSVVYQVVPNALLSTILAAASGVGTGVASALFVTLWGLLLARLSAETIELVIPLSFGMSLACALVVPSMPVVPAVAIALLLVCLCGAFLMLARDGIGRGAIGAAYLAEKPQGIETALEERPLDVARMLAYGAVAWALSSAIPALGSAGSGTVLGVDLISVAGFFLAIVFALAIVRYAVRVDFQALASMTLAPFVLSVTLYAFDNPAAQTVASVLNVATGACFEIVLLLYFVRLAKNKGSRKTMWLATGSAAGYLGVLVGQLVSPLLSQAVAGSASRAMFCLVIVCVYVFATTLIPQRHPYRVGSPVGLAAVSATVKPGPAATTPDSARSPVDAPALPADSLETPGTDAVLVAPKADPVDRACALIAQRYGLSAREAEVCALLAHGRSQIYIRDALFLSKNTVSTHTRHLYAKLDVHSKQELIDLVEAHANGGRADGAASAAGGCKQV